MKYTPGPWIAIRQAGKYEGNYNIGRLEDKGKGPLLTFASIYGPNDICVPEYAAAAEANAALMAASPRMYTALKHIIALFDYLETLDGVIRAGDEVWIEEGRTALAQADGKNV